MVFPTRYDLESYAGDDLPGFETVRVRNHLRGCTACALRVADLRWASEQHDFVRIPEALLGTEGCSGKCTESSVRVAAVA